ncbi:MAG: hypothetical protein HWE13_08280 [Gammaproteobacteria bacterium]|nr:hypothetical protein [Gammaproteobacteria bacterium]NVK88109.1 hypothetical protein [Gammaproteobacteria bacterium]
MAARYNLHQRITLILQLILLAEVSYALWSGLWLTAIVSCGIIIITLSPMFLRKVFDVYIPPEFALMTIAFVFASLFLGEVHGYYQKFWWWDIALHSSSGVLLGIIGFLLVYVLNETENIGIQMKAGFVAFFAFLFALGFGAVWEIFEFFMDQVFGMNMQKPMFDDPSGLTDTMWDLIVDALGAAVISILGYGYLKTAQKQSFLERWIQSFIDKNPRLFKK